jgi:hypothetical protein
MVIGLVAATFLFCKTQNRDTSKRFIRSVFVVAKGTFSERFLKDLEKGE